MFVTLHDPSILICKSNIVELRNFKLVGEGDHNAALFYWPEVSGGGWEGCVTTDTMLQPA